MSEKMPFKVSTDAEFGEDWLIASLGEGVNGIKYHITTNCIHASELYDYSSDAKTDAELIVRLLNNHYASKASPSIPIIELEKVVNSNRIGIRGCDFVDYDALQALINKHNSNSGKVKSS